MLSIPILIATAAMADASWGGRPISNRELMNEKRGRVVEAKTGLGVPDARVIAMWLASSQSIGGSSVGCVLQRVVATDEKGEFVIPNVESDLDLSDRGTKSSGPFTAVGSDFKWTLIVFKPGYLREGDLNSFELNRADPSRVAFAWESIPPSVRGGIRLTWVQDIRMEKAEMSFERSVLYYGAMKQATSCGRVDLEQPGVREVRGEISRLVRSMPCALPPESSVSAAVAMAFSGLLSDDAFNEQMKREGQERWPWTSTTTGAICRATGVRVGTH